jgi:hypothetical protein
METCQNCSRVIGKLETPFVFQNSIVCRKCHELLTETECEPQPAAARKTKPFAARFYNVLLLMFIICTIVGVAASLIAAANDTESAEIVIAGALTLLWVAVPVLFIILVIRFIIWLIRMGTRADEAIENQREIISRISK